MQKLATYLDENPKVLYGVILLLILPALLINLGMMPLLADEKYRALVALEIRLNDNWLVPTVNGLPYFRKPPVFNWLVNGLFFVFGESEFSLRLATVIPLLGFAATLFVVVKKHFTTKIAFLTAISLITISRVLFYDSMLGLIDTLFSWVTFLQLYVIVIYYQKKDYQKLYLLSYILMAVGILLKGLPSIAFQGISLLTIFLYHKDIKGLFSIWNFIGLPIAAGIVSAYFLAYNQYNDASAFLLKLFTESSKRFESEWWEPIVHFIIFPFKGILGQIFPWAFLVIMLGKNHLMRAVKEQRVLFYLLLLTLTNIIPYWISPENRPRYLFMFYPIITLLFIYLYETSELLTRRLQLTNMFLFAFCALLSIGFLVPVFVQHYYLDYIPYLMPKAIGFFLVLALLTWLLGTIKKQKLLILCAFILICRIGFNVMVLPVRAETEPDALHRKALVEVNKILQDKPVRVLRHTPLDEMQSYYISKTKGAIVERVETPTAGYYYITTEKLAKKYDMKIVHKFNATYQDYILCIALLPEDYD